MTEDKVDELEQLFHEDLHCEMAHKDSTCTETVTHIAVDCRRQWLICKIASLVVTEMKKRPGVCKHCQRPMKDCWKVVEA